MKKVTYKVGRSAITGQFKTVQKAKEKPTTNMVVTITRIVKKTKPKK